jgi:hypothetical protein
MGLIIPQEHGDVLKLGLGKPLFRRGSNIKRHQAHSRQRASETTQRRNMRGGGGGAAGIVSQAASVSGYKGAAGHVSGGIAHHRGTRLFNKRALRTIRKAAGYSKQLKHALKLFKKMKTYGHSGMRVQRHQPSHLPMSVVRSYRRK